MKILAIHNDYQMHGGETAVFLTDIQLLKNAGHTVITYTRDNREIANYGFLKKAAFFPNTIFSLKSYFELRRLIRKERPDIAHVYNVFPLLSPSVYTALHSEGVPIVQAVHNFRFLCPNGLFLTHGHICERCKFGNTLHAAYLKCYRNSTLLSLLYAVSIGLHRKLGTFNRIDQFITSTEFTRNKFAEARFTKTEKISILGNYLQLPLPEPLFTKPADGYIAYLGRLSEEKGISTLIKAVAGIEGLTLKIAGDGPERNALQEMVKKLKLERVEFAGQIPEEDKWNFLRNAICTVIPSKCYENFPLLILECMAVGTPVIGSNLGSIPYIIKDRQNGLIYDPSKPDDLKERILWLLDSPEDAKTMAQRGRETIEKDYAPQRHDQQLMRIYETLMQKRVDKKVL
ncbi:MAG: glycosyltransferase family 4 protein [Bellilinea sp.]